MNYLHIIIICILLFSCNNPNESLNNVFGEQTASELQVQLGQGQSLSDIELSPLDYVKWMRDPKNGLHKEKKINNFKYEVQYKTEAFIACIEADDIHKVNYSSRTQQDSISETNHQFNFSISRDGYSGELLKYQLDNSINYEERVKYAAFSIEKDLFLLEGHDTIPCSFSHFERSYGVAPKVTLLIGFISRHKYLEQKTFIYYDRLFGNGIIKFNFNKSDFTKIPILKTSIN